MIIEGVRTTTTKPEQKTHIESKSHTDAHHPWGNTSTSEQRDSFPETDVTTESIYGLLSYATAGGETVSTTTATSIEHKTPLLSDPDAAGVPKVVGSYTDLKVLAKPIPWTAMDDKMKAHLKTKPFPDWDDTSKVTISESSVGTATYTCDYDEFTSSAADLSCYLHYEIPPGLTSDEIASLQPRDQIITKTIKNPAGEVIDTQITTIHLEPGKPSSVFNVSATDETDIPEGGSITLSLLLPVEVVDLAPKLKDETGTEIADSNKPIALPKANGMVEEDAANNRIAHRELKVSIGSALKDKKVTWSMEAKFTPTGSSQPRFRGDWATAAEAHRNRFEASTTYGANGFTEDSQEQAKTTVDANGFTAIRVNVPPWGLNKARIKIQIEGTTTPIDLIDLEVPGVIVIDPGHGIGPAGSSNEIGGTGVATGAQEHAIALDIGTRMAADLRRRRDAEHLPIKVFMTRTGATNQRFIDRTRIARENGCDVYISIHFNSVDNVPTRRHPFGMWDATGNLNLAEDQALARRVRQAVQRAILAVEPAESRDAPTDGITSETHEANLQKGLDTLSDSTDTNTPNFNGNIAGHTPCRAMLMEMEWLGNTKADLLFSEGNTTLSATANSMREEAAQAMADAAIEDLQTQPAQ
jgi:N-acetylmuramoyl-L-alanine amidase